MSEEEDILKKAALAAKQIVVGIDWSDSGSTDSYINDIADDLQKKIDRRLRRMRRKIKIKRIYK